MFFCRLTRQITTSVWRRDTFQSNLLRDAHGFPVPILINTLALFTLTIGCGYYVIVLSLYGLKEIYDIYP